MTVQELNGDELEELRQAVWLQANEYVDCGLVPELTYEQLLIIDESDEIPDSLLYEIFAGISFVKEDFWCNVKAENEV